MENTTEYTKQVLKELCSNFDSYDPWGSLIDIVFDVCAFMFENKMEIPPALMYRPGLGGPDLDSYNAQLLVEANQEMPLDENYLYRFLSAANRRLDSYKAQGLDY